MLARTIDVGSFKTAAELKITEVAFEALVTVLGMLERGEIEAAYFDMQEWWQPGRDRRGRYCGSVGCIGGWMDFVAVRAGHNVGELQPSWKNVDLHELCHPMTLDAWFATPGQAAVAVRNYLTSGDAQWKAVMG